MRGTIDGLITMNKQLAKTLLFSALFFTFLTISVWGYLSAQVPILEALYRSIQLFMLEANFDDVQLPLNWQLETARFVLPLFTIVAVISAALGYFKTQLSLLRCQLFPTEAIFLGCGKTARAIAMNLPKGRTILLVDNNPQQAIPCKFAKQHHTTFLFGCALNRSFIAKLPLSKSKDIYIFTGNDQQDLDIALLVINILLAVGKPHHPLPRLIIDIDDIVLLETAQHDPRFKQYRANGGELVWFSAQKQAARALLLKHPVLASSSKGQDVIHIAICGFTELQQNVVLHILRTGLPRLC